LFSSKKNADDLSVFLLALLALYDSEQPVRVEFAYALISDENKIPHAPEIAMILLFPFDILALLFWPLIEN